MAFDDDYPRSMRDAAVRARRRAMLDEKHIKPLSDYAATLRQDGFEVSDFDPLDGGIDSQVLFLFEKPGPMTSTDSRKRVGSGFISRNNDDTSAEATYSFMQEAGIPRKLTVTWNLIPWWNGTRLVTAPELRRSLESLGGLLRLLPKLSAVVMVGRTACKARSFLEMSGKQVFSSAHPSPLVRARFPDQWRAIPVEWAKVLHVIGGGEIPFTVPRERDRR